MNEATSSEALDRLCLDYGIAIEYTDIWGQRHRASTETKRALLGAMGRAADTEAELACASEQQETRPWPRVLPPAQVVRGTNSPVTIPVTMPASRTDSSYAWRLTLESGENFAGALRPADLEVRARRLVDGEPFVQCAFALPRAPALGYHHFEIEGPDYYRIGMALIVAPARCYQPAVFAEGGRAWGFVVQLYAVRSERNWGIGDFTDLKALIEHSAANGATLLGLNPLCALFPQNPEHCSPYSPSSRLFLNVLYLDVEAIDDLAECQAALALVEGPRFQARLQALRAAELVDYGQIAAVKLEVLELLYRHFQDHHLSRVTERAQVFQAFQQERGEALRQHALFEALQEHFHRDDPTVWGWPVWPEAFHAPDSPAVATFYAAERARVEFYQYLQWQAELQLGAVGLRSLELGLGIGTYQDLPLAADRGGAETWANQQCLSLDARIGAPPDHWNLMGQDWGFPPFIPERLIQAAYTPFIAILRANMRYAGALRLDHVMGLMRLFWIPPGQTPREGTYVSYPLSDLLAIVALESHRNRCLVIGEDLGTVPDEVREAMREHGVLSYHALYFEKERDGSFIAPGDFPRQALVTPTTHDLPTLRGYWLGQDLDLRDRLDLCPSREMREEQIVSRAQDRARLLCALEREKLLPVEASVHPVSLPDMSPEFARAVHVYLARSPAQVMVIAVEDVFGQIDQVNLPGTTDRYPNWRRKLSVDLKEWAAEPRMRALLEAMRQERPTAGQPVCAAEPGPLPIALKIPRATYRLQFNRDFTFAHAAELVPYLHGLGISHCYASPYLKARPGSPHGYDIIDHNALNPEIGTPEEFERFVEALHRHGMGQILDLVPNHMGVGSDNAWWLDVLENGPASYYAKFFDIDWEPITAESHGKLLLPILDDQYGVALEKGELKLAFDPGQGSFSLFYFRHRFPIDPCDYPRILDDQHQRLAGRLGHDARALLEYQSLITAFQHLPGRTETQDEQRTERKRDKEIHKQHLAALCRRYPEIAWFIDETVRELNGAVDYPETFDRLDRLIETQAYRLADWRVASDEINYRRFFDINELAGLRMEDEEVFEATHRLVFGLIARGQIDGVRIDHPDGLYDPKQYLERLQARFISAGVTNAEQGADSTTPPPLYVVIEKILASYEGLVEDWPVYGTTGYRFANLVNGLFVDVSAEGKMDSIYTSFVQGPIDFDELLYGIKKLIMTRSLASERNVLARHLSRMAQANRRTRDFTLSNLRDALTEITACFPVYRTYVAGEVAPADRRYIDWAVSMAKKRGLLTDLSIYDFIRALLLGAADEDRPQAFASAAKVFTMKFQQFTGPVMAKGLEDTSFYIYNRLISLNDVGSDPRTFGISVAAFHHSCQEFARVWPHTLLATSTHDSKRSEDVRARIDVLSEIADEWGTHLRRWERLNRSKKREVDGRPAPSRNDEYLLYQTLIGAWPPLKELDHGNLMALAERIEQYMVKVIREAKVHGGWSNPNLEYEEAASHFVRALLEEPANSRFLADFLPFQRRIARFGMYNSLSQMLLKLTAPGVPDIYQGTEIWDLSLVDPDNRRPVAYDGRRALLEDLQRGFSDHTRDIAIQARALLDRMQDGRIKLYVIWKALGLRAQYPALFSGGSYTPLMSSGDRAEHLCSYARHHEGQTAIVIVPRLVLRLLAGAHAHPLGEAVWGDTRIALPEGFHGSYRNVLTGEDHTPHEGSGGLHLRPAEVLTHFPLALLVQARRVE
jgi:(1->4)-alpha-D-glucan 1-alpha-D-glucosylmutase